MLNKMEGINFKKAFAIFFVALIGFVIIYAIAMAASGNGSELALWWERITLVRLRRRMFTDLQGTFRFFGYLFLIGFNALLALWVYADGKRNNSHKTIFPILTLFTGLIGWLIYMIRHVDRVAKTDSCNVPINSRLGEENFTCRL